MNKYFAMSREEAIEAMKAGKKLKHEYFTSEEYLYMRGNTIYTEDGYDFSAQIYKNDFMVDGWAIVKE